MLFEQKKSNYENIRAHCEKCSNKTKHLVLQSINQSDSEPVDSHDPRYGNVEWLDRYQIIQCQACDNISFRHLSWFSEYQDEYNDGTTEYLYPQQPNNELATREFPNTPEILQRIYKETIDAYNFNAFTLCAGGLRALVEGICDDKQIKNGPIEKTENDGSVKIVRNHKLVGKIAGLHEVGILSKSHSDILHEHRLLGNEALHELKQPSKIELTSAIEIIEHILESLYEIPQKADRLRSSKNKRQGSY